MSLAPPVCQQTSRVSFCPSAVEGPDWREVCRSEEMHDVRLAMFVRTAVGMQHYEPVIFRYANGGQDMSVPLRRLADDPFFAPMGDAWDDARVYT
jgi:hypothetical protein